jgi:hypothetical protein
MTKDDAAYEETPVREVHKSGDVTNGVLQEFVSEGPCE